MVHSLVPMSAEVIMVSPSLPILSFAGPVTDPEQRKSNMSLEKAHDYQLSGTCAIWAFAILMTSSSKDCWPCHNFRLYGSHQHTLHTAKWPDLKKIYRDW